MARTTLRDIASLGLPAEALRTIPTLQAPVVETGAGAGWILPEGAIDVGRTLVGAYDVVVETVAGGAPGVATIRYSLDGGTTFRPTVQTAGIGKALPLAHTGLTVRFEGTLTTGDTWSWTATSALLAAMEAATREMTAALKDRYGPTIIAPFPADLIAHEAALAVWTALYVKGFNPEAAQDRVVMSARAAAREWMKGVAERRLHPDIVATNPPAPIEALSDPLGGTRGAGWDEYD